MPYKDPEQRRAYQRERSRLRRAGRADVPAKVTLPDPIRLQTAQNVVDLLGEQINILRADPGLGTIERARVIAALAGPLLRAVETAHLEARVSAIEDVFEIRRAR